MNVRVMTALNGLAVVAMLLGGCAGNATRDQDPNGLGALPDLEQLPHITLSGAERTEVKALAMGAARSKGWVIGRSAADRMVAQRPLDAGMSATLGVKPAVLKPGTLLEVTSYFVEEGGGVLVATQAAVVTPPPAPKKPAARTDYTVALTDPLTESLAALREVWGEHQGRVARATPPAEGWKDAWSKDAAPIQTQTIRSPAPAPVKPTPPPAPEAEDAGDADDMTPVARPPLSAAGSPAPKVAAIAPPKPQPPAVVKAPAPVVKPVVTAPKVVPPVAVKPAPAKPVAVKPAPVTTGKPVVVVTPKTPVKPAPKGAPVVEVARSAPKPPAKPNSSMMELPKPRPAASTVVKSSVSFAASAEKFARERGCKVSSKGTDLVESRKDGEIHKVPCVGADSILVKCQKGSCKSLL
ncbi:hypothetical protein [Chromatium okenii]|uniref:hypothetical protein n=1 Tax=Chromatium okenii TaxID=61644 RepID=UPI00190726F9|nr:hypothetical protein [Chromatium okenii]